jgi:hypothetical protein
MLRYIFLCLRLVWWPAKLRPSFPKPTQDHPPVVELHLIADGEGEGVTRLAGPHLGRLEHGDHGPPMMPKAGGHPQPVPSRTAG